MTYGNFDLQIFRRERKTNPVVQRQAAEASPARSLLCVPGLSFYPLDYILVKRK